MNPEVHIISLTHIAVGESESQNGKLNSYIASFILQCFPVVISGEPHIGSDFFFFACFPLRLFPFKLLFKFSHSFDILANHFQRITNILVLFSTFP